MMKKALIAVGGLTVYAGAALGTYVYMYEPKDEDNSTITDEERLTIFNANSPQYNTGMTHEFLQILVVLNMIIIHIRN